jgi:hypothetical protein
MGTIWQGMVLAKTTRIREYSPLSWEEMRGVAMVCLVGVASSRWRPAGSSSLIDTFGQRILHTLYIYVTWNPGTQQPRGSGFCTHQSRFAPHWHVEQIPADIRHETQNPSHTRHVAGYCTALMRLMTLHTQDTWHRILHTRETRDTGSGKAPDVTKEAQNRSHTCTCSIFALDCGVQEVEIDYWHVYNQRWKWPDSFHHNIEIEIDMRSIDHSMQIVLKQFAHIQM